MTTHAAADLLDGSTTATAPHIGDTDLLELIATLQRTCDALVSIEQSSTTLDNELSLHDLAAEDRHLVRLLVAALRSTGSTRHALTAQLERPEPDPAGLSIDDAQGLDEEHQSDFESLPPVLLPDNSQSKEKATPTAQGTTGPPTQDSTTAALQAGATPSPNLADVFPSQPAIESTPLLSKPRTLRGRLLTAARVGQALEGQLDLPEGFIGNTVAGLGESGLTLDLGAGILRGTPLKDGPLSIRLSGVVDDYPVEVEVVVPINPDPWSLWKTIPSDPSARFAKPDEEASGLDGDLRLVLARQRGRKHANTGAPCDDDAGIAMDPVSGWHIGVVTDGAGSALYSRQGSLVVRESILRTVLPALGQRITPVIEAGDEQAIRKELYHVLVGGAFEAVTELERVAKDHGEDIDHFATTLIVGAARRMGDGWFCVSYSVGDGLAILWDAEAPSATRMMVGDSGEFAGQTRFLRRADFQDAHDNMRRIHIVRPARFTAFILMTDGVSDARFPTQLTETDPEHWGAIWRDELAPVLAGDDSAGAAASRLLDWLNFRVPGEHDDRSMVVMLPRADR